MGMVNIPAALSAALVQSGTVAFTYPAGYNKGSFVTYGAQLVTGTNDVFSTANGDITVSLGNTSATITLRAATSIAAGTSVTLGLKTIGIENYKDQIENKIKVHAVEKKVMRVK